MSASSPVTVAFQPATLADIPTIITLAEATWEPTYRFILSKEQIDYMYRVIYTPASLHRQMTDDQHSFLLLLVEGHPAGYASFSRVRTGEALYKLHKIYVLPSHQGQGLGQRLVKEVENAVRAAGGNTLELNVNRYNPAVSFYERLGYQHHREDDIPIGPYWMNDFILRKEVA